jgi:hypothetical protein
VLSTFNVRDVFAVALFAAGLKPVAITTRARKNATLFHRSIIVGVKPKTLSIASIKDLVWDGLRVFLKS